MQISLVAGLALLAGAQAHLWSKPAVKLISRPKEAVASNYTWTISDWNANCADSGCFAGRWTPSPAPSSLQTSRRR